MVNIDMDAIFFLFDIFVMVDPESFVVGGLARAGMLAVEVLLVEVASVAMSVAHGMVLCFMDKGRGVVTA